MTQEVCTGVQFVTAAFLTVCSSSCQQEKKQSLISVKCFDCGISVFVLHCFMQGLDTYCWRLGLLLKDGVFKLETWLLRNEANAQNHLWNSENNKLQRTGLSVREYASLEGI